MATLDERQTKILKAIIEEYISTASPVGSLTIEKKYNLGISPATIRNEMVKLTSDGFLRKAHSSSGRIPTPMALKYYVTNLMREQQLSLSEEVSVKERVWDYRHEMDKLLREMTRELANRTNELAIAVTDEGNIYTAGTANILDAPEFYDIDLTKTLLSSFDEKSFWEDLVNRSISEEIVDFLLGSDLGNEIFEPCCFIFSRFSAGPRKGAIGVIGPVRTNFSRVFPTVRYFKELLDEIFRV